jgi:GntR family transcriptional regulator/MocR family aminotransferase
MPVDGQGADISSLTEKKISAVYVTPSHQFPLGGILPATRRAALIRLAIKEDFYIIEDDYDSEFRYCGCPVSPIYSIDSSHVVYVGTFSKSIFRRFGWASPYCQSRCSQNGSITELHGHSKPDSGTGGVG